MVHATGYARLGGCENVEDGERQARAWVEANPLPEK
jgi:hypothetical protein